MRSFVVSVLSSIQVQDKHPLIIMDMTLFRKWKLKIAGKVRRLLLSAKEVITSDALIFLSPKMQETEAIRNEQLQYRA